MLIENTNPKKGEIMVGKLITGEEIIGRVENIDNTSISIKRPLTLNLIADPRNGQATVAPMPWSLGISDDAVVKIDLSKFIFFTKARQEIVSSYTRATTGIEIAGANSDFLRNSGNR